MWGAYRYRIKDTGGNRDTHERPVGWGGGTCQISTTDRTHASRANRTRHTSSSTQSHAKQQKGETSGTTTCFKGFFPLHLLCADLFSETSRFNISGFVAHSLDLSDL